MELLALRKLPRETINGRTLADYGPLSDEARAEVIKQMTKRQEQHQLRQRILKARAEVAARQVKP